MSNYINSLTNYIERGQFKRLDESQLFIQYGRELDSIDYKFKTYTNNHINNRVDENISGIFTPAESVAITNVFLNVLEEYKQTLLNEQNIYEQYLNGTLVIEEGLFNNLTNSVKNVIKKGAESVKTGLETLKTKIVELTKFIKEVIAKGIKSIKEFSLKLVALFEKCKIPTVSALVEKLGMDPNSMEKGFVTNNDAIVKNIDSLKQDNIYESLGNDIKYRLLLEAEEGNVVSQGEKKGWKSKIKEMFMGFVKYATVCFVIPGIVVGLFPGTFIALLVPIACKLLWNCYSLVKIYKQIKELCKNWKTLGKVQKIISVLCIVASIISIVINVKTSLLDMGTVVKEWANNGFDLLSKAQIGVQPDAITKGIGAIVKSLREGKFSADSIKEAYQEITDSFAKVVEVEVSYGDGIKVDDALDKVKNGNWKNSMKCLNDIKKDCLDPSTVADNVDVNVIADGTFNGTNTWSKALIKLGEKYGVSADDLFNASKSALNKGLNSVNNMAGSLTGFEGLPSDFVKAAMAEGILGHNGHSGILSICSTITSVLDAGVAMTAALPIIEYTPKNAGGFRVRLGSEDEKDNYIYEIGPKGIRTEDFDDESKIKDVVDESKKYYEELQKNAESDEDKKKLEEEYNKFTETFKKEYKNIKRVVFYGKRVKDESSTNESSLVSINNYIFEKKEYNIENPDKETIFKNLQDLRKYIESFCKKYTKEVDANGKQIIQKADSTLAGSTQIILRSLFATNVKSKTSTFEFDKDFDDTEDSKKSIKKRALTKETTDDKFGPKDIYTLAVFLNKHAFDDCSVDDINEALIDVVLIKNQLNKSSEITDIIKVLYMNIVNNLSNSNKFKEHIADEWNPGKNWAPLKFDIENIDDKTKEEVENVENKLDPSEEEKEEAEEKVENEDKTEENTEDDKKEDDKKEDDKKEDDNDEEIAVLEFIPFFECYDIADANEKGPRKEPYSFKGSFLDLEFIEISGGTSKSDIESLLGELLYNMVNNCYSLIADKPFIKDNKKFIVNKNSLYQTDQERPELANFTNDELTNIINNKKEAKKYLSIPTSKITVAKTKKEKEQITELEKINNEKLKNNKELKKVRPDLFDSKGNLKEKEWQEFNKGLANYQLGEKKKEKSSGIFSKLWQNIKGLFGFKKSDFEKADKLLKSDNKTNESVEEVFKKHISLTTYLKENLN
jgi:hypothetical protein